MDGWMDGCVCVCVFRYRLQTSMTEIYNDEIQDLLIDANDTRPPRKLAIRTVSTSQTDTQHTHTRQTGADLDVLCVCVCVCVFVRVRRATTCPIW